MTRARSTLIVILLLAGLFVEAAGTPTTWAQPPVHPLGGSMGADSEAELAAAETRVARVESEIEGLVAQRDGARQRVRSRVRVLYRLRRAGVLPLAGGFEALIRHVGRVDRLERMVSEDVASLSRLSRRVAALSSETTRLNDALLQAQARVESDRTQRENETAQMQLLGQMIEDPAAWSNGPGFGVRYADGTPPSSFAQRRGALPLPVSGSATVAPATREGGEGVELTASRGVSVRAVEGGRVAYAAPHAAYRQLVIVDHGDGYFTVYGGLASIGVGAGHSVARDAVVGTVGDEPVFFQVRRGSRPLPARAWLGI
ncbi:MAG: murein hydrolase activator EnvC [Sandaracinaceae bacterium]